MGGTGAAKLRLRKQAAMMQERECLLIEDNSSADVNSIYWVDPSRDYCVVRHTCNGRDGKPFFKLDIDYRADKDVRWIPGSWGIEWFNPGQDVPVSTRVNVDSYKINSFIPEHSFEVKLAPGTLVSDMRTTPSQEYLVKANDEKRMIPRSELDATYEQLINTEPGFAHEFEREASTRWWTAAIIVLCAVAGLIAIWRRWKRVSTYQ
jgi:hypothetical protein